MKLSLNKTSVFFIAVAMIATLFFINQKRSSSLLYKIKHDNKLNIVTRNSPTTYYIGPNGPTGFEYELAKQFANYLGVELNIVVIFSYSSFNA